MVFFFLFFFLTLFIVFHFNGLYLVVYQMYRTEVNNEHVIKGNSAIFKCVIPSFVADFVSVSGWVDDVGGSFFLDAQYGKFKSLIVLGLFFNFMLLFQRLWVYFLKILLLFQRLFGWCAEFRIFYPHIFFLLICIFYFVLVLFLTSTSCFFSG